MKEFEVEIKDEDQVENSELEIQEIMANDDVEFPEPNKPEEKVKKKSKKGLIIGLSITGVAVVTIIVLLFTVILPFLNKPRPIIGDATGVLAKDGYQQYVVDTSSLEIRPDSEFGRIYSVDEMLADLNLKQKMESNRLTQDEENLLASSLFNLAVTNYAALQNTSWYCYTDSSVYAKEVKVSFIKADTFEVGVRAAYMISSSYTNNPKNEGRSNEFSSTISGLTKFDVSGFPQSLQNAIISSFGFNIQNVLYEGTFAYRRGKDSGANFYGDDSEEGYLYPMGAWNNTFPTELAEKVNSKGARQPNHFSMKAYDPKTDDVSQALDNMTYPEDIVVKRAKPWSPLNTYYNYSYTSKCYSNETRYYTGNYGAGWATYNFKTEFLDEATTVEYNPDTRVYTINMVVKEENMDEACLFAKGGLTKDTKDYITMHNPTYTLSKNIIQIFDNGLIKCWDREETVATTNKAQLTVLSGDCNGGGGTTNATFSSFSFDKADCDPLGMAARYFPEVGNPNIVGEVAWDLSKYPTLDQYTPKKNGIGQKD